jgi:hypothetical protein
MRTKSIVAAALLCMAPATTAELPPGVDPVTLA